MKWKTFDKLASRGRSLPPQGRKVLVACSPKEEGQAPPVAVGYLKFGAGDKDSPYFVVPGVLHREVVAWCDCLGDDFDAPVWPEIMSNRERITPEQKRLRKF